jgi:hypothetical protein
MHHGETYATDSYAHHNTQGKHPPHIRNHSCDDQGVRNEVQGKHENSFKDHFGVAAATEIPAFEILIYSLVQGRIKLGLC